MTEPIIACPNCKTEIKLTESLAVPHIEARRREFEHRLVQKKGDISNPEAALAKAQQALNEQSAEMMNHECARITAEEARKPKLAGTYSDISSTVSRLRQTREGDASYGATVICVYASLYFEDEGAVR